MKVSPMTENTSKEKQGDFPYPKLIRTINYFFPKEEGARDVLTIKNLKKFSRYAPFLALGITALLLCLLIRDLNIVMNTKACPVFAICIFWDFGGFLLSFTTFLYWLGAATVAKLAKRSTMTPKAMSFFEVAKILGGFSVFRLILGVLTFFGSLT